jgi:hypothetical protein
LLVVSMSGASPVTVIVSASAATFRFMLTVSSWPSVSGTRLRTATAKPLKSALIS